MAAFGLLLSEPKAALGFLLSEPEAALELMREPCVRYVSLAEERTRSAPRGGPGIGFDRTCAEVA